jgi:putative aldouronate transport system permease protein
MKRGITFSSIFIHVFLLIGALVCLLPVVNILAISFSDSAIAVTGKVYFIPKQFTIASYSKLITEGTFGRAFMISVIRVIAALVISMPVMTMMAYALSKNKKNFRERNIIMWMAVFTMLFNGGLIPTYVVMMTYHLINSFWALVLPLVMNVYNMLILMNFFRGIPAELEEAATIDGAGAFRTLWSVYLPISLPVLATISLFTVVNHWNDFFWGLIYINNSQNYPLQTYIRSLTMKIDFSAFMDPKLLAEQLKVNSITFSAAKIVVSMIPILCIYPFLQRYFVSGLVLGSVKE